jgi:hypothetical protein
MWSLAVAAMSAINRVATHASGSPAPPHLDVIALFGFLSAVVTLACLPHLRSSRPMRLIFTASLAANAIYAFLSGAWPLGMVGIVATAMAIHRCWRDWPICHTWSINSFPRHRVGENRPTAAASRVSRLFGSNVEGPRTPSTN